MASPFFILSDGHVSWGTNRFQGYPAVLMEFLFLYPLVLSFLWTTHGAIYLVQSWIPRRSDAEGSVFSYTVIVPFHDEPDGALRTAWSLAHVSPTPQEVLLVDDGSARTVPEGAKLPPRTRVVRLEERAGKARALNTALREVESELVVCLDADTTAASQDWRALMSNFEDPAAGAITGKIWPSNLKGLIQRLQHLDYVSVICLIKAAENTWDALLTVSGAFVAYRRSALLSVGGWNETTATEDIDLSWRLQSRGWRIGYEDRWVGRVEMVPTLSGLWRQRRRWSMGLGRTMRDHLLKSCGSSASQLPVAMISLFNTAWIALTFLGAGWIAADTLFGTGEAAGDVWAIARENSAYLLLSLPVFGSQFAIAAAIDRRSLKTYAVLIVLAPLYPFYFWGILFTSFLAGFPVGLMRRDGGMWKRTLRTHEAISTGVSP